MSVHSFSVPLLFLISITIFSTFVNWYIQTYSLSTPPPPDSTLIPILHTTLPPALFIVYNLMYCSAFRLTRIIRTIMTFSPLEMMTMIMMIAFTEIRSTQIVDPGDFFFSRRSCRDSNPRPFNHESGALTTELSPLCVICVLVDIINIILSLIK